MSNKKPTRLVTTCALFFVLAGIFLGNGGMIPSQVQKPVNQVDDYSSYKAKTAGEFDFIQMPSVSSQYISPDTTFGEGDFTIYSFSVNYDANYSLDVFASHEPLNHEGFFQPMAAYYMPNGTWVLGASSRTVNIADKWTIWVGIGSNASSISWQAVGTANTTVQMAIAANTTSIRLVYFESDVVSYSSDEPIKWVKYFATDDWGSTWRNDTLWDVSAWSDLWFSGVSMAAWGNTFECTWGFSNASDEDWPRYEIASVWETRSLGDGWTQPGNLTALLGNASYSPQVFFNQGSGKIYVCVNNYSGSYETESLLLELGDGIDAQATDIWVLSPSTDENSYARQVYCTLDYENNVFYFINRTKGQDGIRNATGWKGVLSDVDLCVTGARNSYYFNLFAKGGKPKIFAGAVLSNLYGYKAGLLECEPPFFFYHLNNSIDSAETMFYVFNGRDANGLTHGTRAYYFNLSVIREVGDPLHNQLIVTRDDVPPEIQLGTSSPVISPFESPGVSDSFEVNVTASKPGTAILTIESLDRQVNGSVDITDGLWSYTFPSLCGDGIRNFLFFTQTEGTLMKIMFAKSSDGGLSWTNPRELKRLTANIEIIKAIYREQKIYCWMKADTETYLFISPDEGATFINAKIPSRVTQVAEDLSCWDAHWYTPGSSYINFSRSLDLGTTWSDFISVPLVTVNEFSQFDGVASDPISGNYSFILTNQTTNHTRFITANNDGTIFTSWDGFGDDGHGFGSGYAGYMQLDCRLLDDHTSEWIITSIDYNEVVLSSMTSYVAYTTTKGDGQFSAWQNFTGISGNFLNATLSPTWDLLFPGNSTPCFVTGFFNFDTMQFSQMQVDYGTRLVFETRDDFSSAGTLGLSFNGLSNAFEILTEGAYSWTVTCSDFGGQSISKNGMLAIDNSIPLFNPYANLTTPEHPDPRYPVTVTIPTSDLRLSTGILLYSTSPTGPWTLIEMAHLPTGPDIANFTGTFPIMGDVTVYWRAVINDTAGNTLVVDNAGQPFTYTKPQLRLEEEFEPPTELDLSEHSTYEVRFLVPEDSEYMASVIIEYAFDDGTGTHVAYMTRTGSSIFNFTFSTFPENVTTLTYTVIGFDVYGNQVPFGRSRTLALVPALPPWEMSAVEQVFVLLIALGVGIVCGIVYSSMIRQRTGGRILTKELVERVIQEAREQPALELQDQQKKKSPGKVEKTSLIALSFALAGGIAGIGGAAVFLIMYQWPEAAMLCLVGTMLAMVFLWILTTDSAVRRTLRANKAKIPPGKILGIFLVGLTIFASVLAILFVGNTVAWWRVRVNDEAYNIMGLEIPQMITTLAGTFFSSIILLTWSVGKDVTKTVQELQDAEANNENPGRIIALRESRTAGILGAVGWKGVLFIAIIGATLIFASDLSVYAPQGLIIIIPFVVGAVVTLAVKSLQKLKTGGKEGSMPMFFDRVGKCPACGVETPVGGAFCENCGAKVITGERVKEGQVCPACKQPTTAGVKHCRYCGNALNITPSAPNLQASEGMKKDSP